MPSRILFRVIVNAPRGRDGDCPNATGTDTIYGNSRLFEFRRMASVPRAKQGKQLWDVFIILAVVAASLIGCSSAAKMRAPKNPDPVIEGEVTQQKAQQALEMKLSREIKYLQENAESFKTQALPVRINQTTYFYKYYDEFPEGPGAVTISISPTKTLAPSYTAEAKYRKIRYQTRYSKSRSKASSDSDFIRDEGTQKDSYSFDGQIWRLRNSIFEATKTSVYREDQWVPSQARIRRLEEEKPEYFVDKLRTLFGLLD